MTGPRRWLAGLAVVAGCVMALPTVFGVGRTDPRGTPSLSPATAAAASAAATISPTSSGTRPAVASPPTVDPAASPSLDSPSPAATPSSSEPPTADGVVPGSVNATSIDLTAEYDATVRLNFGTRSFHVTETISVTNTSGTSIDRLELNTIAARLGHLDIGLSRVDNVPVHAAVSDQTITLPLGGVLQPGATTRVRIGFSAILRSGTAGSDWLFTRANGIVEAHRWLPWISRPTPFSRPNHGDPFVTPVSPRVRVTIASDRRIRWATTGEPTGPTATTMTFEATNVRDFAMVGAPDFGTSTASVGGVTIVVWGRPGFPRSTVLSAAKVALARESRLLGAYPYRRYELAQSAGGFGMESPGLTWIPTNAGSLQYLVAHETGHQWFYGIVGNDQARQPYADEAATDFVARYVLGDRRGSRCANSRLDLSIYRYSSSCYYEIVYIQGGNFLDDLRKTMGSTAFWAGMRDYLAANRFKIAGTKTLLDTLDRHTSRNLIPHFEPRFPSFYPS